MICAFSQGGKYVDLLKPNTINLSQNIKPATVTPITIKPPSYMYDIQRITWTEDELRGLNTIENLQYAVIRKFPIGGKGLMIFGLKFPKNEMWRMDVRLGY